MLLYRYLLLLFIYKKTEISIINENFKPRNLLLTRLVEIYPKMTYLNVNSHTFDLTFDDNGTISTVSIFINGGPTKTMTIGQMNNGVLRITSDTAFTTAGEYSFNIVNSIGTSINTSGVTLSVLNNLAIQFFTFTNKKNAQYLNKAIACIDTDFEIRVTFSQNIYDGLITGGKLTDANNSNSVKNLSLYPGISYTINFVVLTAYSWGSEANLLISVTTRDGLLLSSTTQLQVGYQLSLFSGNSFTPKIISPTCSFVNTMTFNKQIDGGVFAKGLVSFPTPTEYSSNQLSASNTVLSFPALVAPGVEGNWAIKTTDTCGIDYTRTNIAVTITTLDATSKTECAYSGVSFTTILTFSRNFDDNFISTITATTGGIPPLYVTDSSPSKASSNTYNSNLNLSEGVWSLSATDSCGKTVNAKAASPTSITVKNLPSITSISPNIFTVTAIFTDITLSQTVNASDIVDIFLINSSNVSQTIPKVTGWSIANGRGTVVSIITGSQATGSYTVKISYWCSNNIMSSTGAIKVVAVPAITDLTNCVVNTSNFVINVAYDSMDNPALIKSASIFNSANNKIADLTTGTASNNVLTFSANSNNVIGLMKIETYTNSKDTITTAKTTKLSGVMKLNSADRSIWDTNTGMTLIATFSDNVPTNFISSFKLTQITTVSNVAVALANAVIVNSSSTTGPTNKAWTGTFPGVYLPGVYSLTATDWCANTVVMDAQVKIRYTTIPTISSLSDTCYNVGVLPNAFDLTITFSQLIYPNQIDTVQLINVTTNVSANLAVKSITGSSSTSLVVTGSTSLTGIYRLNIVDVAGKIITTTTRILYTNEKNPSFTIDKNNWDSNYSLTLSYTTSTTLVNTQITGLSLFDANNVESPLNINTISDKVILTYGFKLNAGTYTSKIFNACNSGITSGTIVISDLPVVTSFQQDNSNCSVINVLTFMTPFTFTVNLNPPTAPGSLINSSTSLINKSSNLVEGSLASTSGSGSSMTVNWNSIPSRNEYVIRLTTAANQIITSTVTLHNLRFSTTCSDVNYPVWQTNIPFTFAFTYQQTLFDGQVVSLSLNQGASTTTLVLGTKSGSTISASGTLSNTGQFNLISTDFCKQQQIINNMIRIVDLPTFSSMEINSGDKGLCAARNTAFSLKVTFNQDIYNSFLTTFDYGGAQNVVFSDNRNLILTYINSSFPNILKTYIKINTVAGTSVTTTKYLRIKNTPASPTITDITPKVWDLNVPITKITITLSRSLESDEIESFDMFNTDKVTLLGQGTVVSFSNNQVIVSYPSISIYGSYWLRLLDHCGRYIFSNSALYIQNKVSITSFSSKCFLQNINLSFITTFLNTNTAPSIKPIEWSQFKSIQVVNNAATSLNGWGTYTMTLASTNSVDSITLTNQNGFPAGFYNLYILDSSDQTITTTQQIISVSTLDPASIISVSPNIYDTNIVIYLTLTLNRSVVATELTNIRLKRRSDNFVFPDVTIINVNNNIVQISSDALSSAGGYDILLLNYCGNTNPNLNVLTLVTKPDVVSITPFCSFPNIAFTSTVTFNNSLMAGQITKVNAVNIAGGSIVDLPVGTINSNIMTLNFNNGLGPGFYTFSFRDSSLQYINTVNKIFLTVGTYTTTVASVDPMIYDLNVPIVLTLTMSRILESGEIASAKIIKTDDSNNITNGNIDSMSGTTVVISASSISVLGNYRITLTDFCSKVISSNININFVNKPLITTVSPVCNLKNALTTVNATFNGNLSTGQMRSVNAINRAGTLTSMALGGFNQATQSAISANGLPVGFYTLSFKDSSQQFINSSMEFIMVDTLTAVSMSSVNPPVLDVKLPISISIVMNRNMGDTEIRTFSLKNRTTNVITIGSISSINTNTVVVVSQAISVTGAYDIILTDYCGNTLTFENTVNIVNIPSITGMSPYCYLPNTKITTKVSFSNNLLTGQLSAVSAINTQPLSTPVTFSLGTFTNKDQMISSTDNGLASGYYTLGFTDSSSQSINSASNIFVTYASAAPVVQSIYPYFFTINTPINFKIKFTTVLFVGRITSIKLTSSNGLSYSTVIGNITGDNEITVGVNTGITIYDNFSVSGTDVCGNNFNTDLKVSTLEKFSVVSFSPTCAPTNSVININIDTDKNLPAGFVASTSLGDGFNNFPLTLKTPVVGTSFQATTLGISKTGLYNLNVYDQSSNSVNPLQKFEIMASVPVISFITPSQFLKSEQIKFTIQFDRNIMVGYITSIFLTDINGTSYSLSSTNIIDNKVFVQPASSLPVFTVGQDLRLKVNICNTQQSNVIVRIVDPNNQNTPGSTNGNTGNTSNNSGSGSDSTSTGNNTNITTCPLGSVLSNSKCVSCQASNRYYNAGVCVDSCPPSMSYIYNNYICTSTCELYSTFSFNKNCIAACPVGYYAGFNSVCVSCSSLSQFWLNGNCVNSCPQNYTTNKSAYTCDPILNIFDDSQKFTVTCGDNTCNGGKCSVIFNNQIKCDCPANKTGLLCDTDVTKVNVNTMTDLISQITSTNTPNIGTYQLTMTADNLLQNSGSNLYTPYNSNKIYTYTANQLQSVATTSSATFDPNVLKLVNLAFSFKSQELNSIRQGKKLRLLPEIDRNNTIYDDYNYKNYRYLQSNNSSTITINSVFDLSNAIKNYLSQKLKIKNEIQNLVNLTNTYVENYIKNRTDFNTSSSILFGNTYVSVQIAFNNPSSIADFANSASTNKLVSVDYSKCLEKIQSTMTSSNKNLILSKIDYSYLLNQFLERTDLSSNLVYFNVWDYSTRNQYDLSVCSASTNPVLMKFPINSKQIIRLNNNIYQSLKSSLDMDVYNIQDPYYNSRCKDTGEYYPYDTTLQYRREVVFQNISISCGNTGINTANTCLYDGLRDSFGYIYCNCTITKGVGSDVIDYIFPKSSDINLDLVLCPDRGFNNNIYKNAGFWISLSAVLAMILFGQIHLCIFPDVIQNKFKRENALEYDDIIETDYKKIVSETENPKNVVHPADKLPNKGNLKEEPVGYDAGKVVKSEEIVRNIKSRYRTFCEIFIQSLIANHPILTLFYHSILMPFGIKFTLFVFKTFMYFSWNAFIFTDNYMIKRIYNDFRDNFAYPMQHEFGKIFASIVITSVQLVIIRLIINHSVDDVNELIDEYKTVDEPRRIAACQNLNSKMTVSYSVALVIIYIFTGFFFYFNTVFCGVYPKASVGWFYSGVWSLMWIWMVFSPFFILLLSILEYCGKSNSCCLCIYTWLSYTLQFIF